MQTGQIKVIQSEDAYRFIIRPRHSRRRT